MTTQSLANEIVRMIEAGINKHLNRSILYSPFRLFYNLFKKSNPRTIQNIRDLVSEDIAQCLDNLPNFNPDIFIVRTQHSEVGKLLMKKCYNIGIRLLKYDLTVGKAFSLIRNRNLQQQVYEHILSQIEQAILELSPKMIKQTDKKLDTKTDG